MVGSADKRGFQRGRLQTARSSLSAVVYISAARPVIPSDNHRPSLVSCCSLQSGIFYLFTSSHLDTATLRQQLKTFVFQRSFHVTLLHYTIVGFVMAIAIHSTALKQL